MDETTVNLNQGDSKATVNSFNLYHFHTNQWLECDSIEQEEGTIVAGRVAWRLGVAVEIMEDKSPEYI
jgi:hypothetical protein